MHRTKKKIHKSKSSKKKSIQNTLQTDSYFLIIYDSKKYLSFQLSKSFSVTPERRLKKKLK